MPARKRTMEFGLADWDRLRAALAVHREGTLSAAARTLKVDHTTVARRIAAIEHDLGALLFEKSPTGYTATPVGEEVIAVAERVETEIDGLLRRVHGSSVQLSGRVRLTATPHIAASLIAPALGELLRTHSGLQIELFGDNRALDLSRREADIAVRLSRPDIPGLIVRQLGQIAFAFYASSSDKRSFANQAFLSYEEPSGSTTLQRYLAELVSSEGIVLRSNTMHALAEAGRAGLGAAILPCFVADRDKALRRLPAPRRMPLLPLWVIYHEDLRRSPRVKAVVTFLDELIQSNRGILVPPHSYAE